MGAKVLVNVSVWLPVDMKIHQVIGRYHDSDVSFVCEIQGTEVATVKEDVMAGLKTNDELFGMSDESLAAHARFHLRQIEDTMAMLEKRGYSVGIKRKVDGIVDKVIRPLELNIHKQTFL